MDLAAWRAAVDCDWRVLDVAPKELCAEHEALRRAGKEEQSRECGVPLQ